jgi:predicted lipoprotein
MKKFLMPLVLAIALGVSTLPAPAQAETTQQEKAAHPRIAQAIDDLEAAVQYMEGAPHDFGGHKAAALQASRQALQQLRLAIKYRAAQDTKKGK